MAKDSLTVTDKSPDLSAPLLVDGAVLIENPEYDAVRAMLNRQHGVTLHYRQFRLRVTKPCSARPGHDDNGNREPRFCLNDRPERGG